jgi:hypothetical protein
LVFDCSQTQIPSGLEKPFGRFGLATCKARPSSAHVLSAVDTCQCSQLGTPNSSAGRRPLFLLQGRGNPLLMSADT